MLGRLHYYQTTTMPIACKWHCTSRGLATMAGGDFWEGVCNSLICSGLNHAMHLAVKVISPEDPPGGKKNNAQQLKKQSEECSCDCRC